MGCCQSKENDDLDEPSATDPLLGPNHDARRGSKAPNSVDGQTNQNNSDDQSALNRILHQTAANIIDLTGNEAPIVEENDSALRSRQYAQRLSRFTLPASSKLGKGVANPYGALSQPGLPSSDLDLVTEAAEKTAHCVKKVVVHHKEELVVPFGVP